MYVFMHVYIYTCIHTDYSYLIRLLLIRKQWNDLRKCLKHYIFNFLHIYITLTTLTQVVAVTLLCN